MQGGGALPPLSRSLARRQSALDLADASNDPHRVTGCRARARPFVALRDGENEPVARERRHSNRDAGSPDARPRSVCGQSDRENYRSAEWQNGKAFWPLTHLEVPG